MNATQHTPGPWVWEPTLSAMDDVLQWDPIIAADGCEVCRVLTATPDGSNGGTRDTTPEQDAAEGAANARLIAAAPDLLEALRGILQSAGYESGEAIDSLRELNVGRHYLDRALAAMRKATA